jgi:hypothetical protein
MGAAATGGPPGASGRPAERAIKVARGLLLAYLLLVVATAAFGYAALDTHLFGPPDDSGLAGIWLLLVTLPASAVLPALLDRVVPHGTAFIPVLVTAGVLQGGLTYAVVVAWIRRGASPVDQA